MYINFQTDLTTDETMQISSCKLMWLQKLCASVEVDEIEQWNWQLTHKNIYSLSPLDHCCLCICFAYCQIGCDATEGWWYIVSYRHFRVKYAHACHTTKFTIDSVNTNGIYRWWLKFLHISKLVEQQRDLSTFECLPSHFWSMCNIF